MPGIRPLMAVPVVLVAVFCGLLAFRMMDDAPTGLQSVLIGNPAPPLAPAALGPEPPPSSEDLGQPELKLVNFWASWCAPCRVEHPSLAGLAATGLTILGINYKDQDSHALQFLAELGNPFKSIGADRDGAIAIDWGVYGVPETFIVDGAGVVQLRIAGPITGRVVESIVLPELERLRGR